MYTQLRMRIEGKSGYCSLGDCSDQTKPFFQLGRKWVRVRSKGNKADRKDLSPAVQEERSSKCAQFFFAEPGCSYDEEACAQMLQRCKRSTPGKCFGRMYLNVRAAHICLGLLFQGAADGSLICQALGLQVRSSLPPHWPKNCWTQLGKGTNAAENVEKLVQRGSRPRARMEGQPRGVMRICCIDTWRRAQRDRDHSRKDRALDGTIPEKTGH